MTQEPPSRRLRRASFAVALFASVLVPVLADASVAEEACSAGAFGHGRPYLTGFTAPFDAGSKFYAVPESAGNADVTIAVTPGHCNDQPGSQATYATQDGTAAAGHDYSARSGTTGLLCSDFDQQETFCGSKPPAEVVAVPVISDGAAEDAVETFLVRLTGGAPFGLAEPSEAPVHLIDVNGSKRVSLEPTAASAGAVAYQQYESWTVRIPVFWAGPLPASDVAYTIGPPPAGMAAATAGQDYTVLSSNPLSFGSGRIAYIRIQLLKDSLVEGDESMSITLNPSAGYEVAEPSSTTLTIIDNNRDRIAPGTWFHHPRQGFKYKRADYRIREFHTFFRDEGGSGIATAHLALRRKMKSGVCQWWHGSGFRTGKCGKKVWKKMRFERELDLFYARFPALRPTVGTKIRNYTAWTRGVDRAGNVERDFQRGRNLSTFWIRKR